jgi:hypothetical protein
VTRAEKFAICRALFHAELRLTPNPLVRQQFTCAVNAVAEVVCPKPDEYLTFRKLCCDRDNWIDQDNPFKDDA